MADTLERAAVRVGGVEIPAAAIAAEAQNHPAADADAAWTAAAEALAIRQLLLAEADRQGIVADERSDPDGRLLTEEDARIDALLAETVRVPQATSEEARRYYDRHHDRFASETLIEAEHILLSADPGDSFSYGLAVGDARMLIRRIAAEPASFADLAREYSACPSKAQGGNLGQIGRGQTVRAGRRIEGLQLPFEAVEATIRDYLEEASTRRAMAQYLSIIASETEIEGVVLPIAEGPLVQ
jgi:peptidyl-prolyl cis-trans isomerase C